VQRGDTLTEIAAKTGTSVKALMAANKDIRNANQIYPGQVVQIPSGIGAKVAPRVQAPQAPRVQQAPVPKGPDAKAPVATAPVAPKGPVGQTSGGQINLQDFFDPTKGSKSPAAIVIGNAEGNRTPNDGFRASYTSHIDPGNGKGNRGSFSYQHGTKGTTPEQADRLQLAKLSNQIPAYEAAARKAGLDPKNATLATAYFDLFNQSETAAVRFLNQIGYLKLAGISNQSVTELRFRSFINPETGQRWTPGTASGFQKIAYERYGKNATEAEFQTVIRDDQARRQNAMVGAMKAQGINSSDGSPKAPAPKPNVETGAVGARPAGSGVLTKWPVSNPKLNVADKSGEGDGHYGTRRARGQHGGVDLVGKLGDPISAAGKGVVVDIQPQVSSTFGYQVVIDHGNGVFTQYAHLQPGSITVKPGDTVVAGQPIAGMGRSGNTPKSGDTHLHFEVRIGSPLPAAAGGKTVDPLKYLGQPQ
jgi:murein DD-endopeptidase MepM/ murein hydrolase activator NlpD